MSRCHASSSLCNTSVQVPRMRAHDMANDCLVPRCLVPRALHPCVCACVCVYNVCRRVRSQTRRHCRPQQTGRHLSKTSVYRRTCLRRCGSTCVMCASLSLYTTSLFFAVASSIDAHADTIRMLVIVRLCSCTCLCGACMVACRLFARPRKTRSAGSVMTRQTMRTWTVTDTWPQ